MGVFGSAFTWGKLNWSSLRAPERPHFKHLNPGDVTGTQAIGRGHLTTRALGPFCRSEGAQSTTQPWNTDTLSMRVERLEKNQIPNSLKIDRIFTQHLKFARTAMGAWKGAVADQRNCPPLMQKNISTGEK